MLRDLHSGSLQRIDWAAEQEDFDEMIRLEKRTATTEIDFERIARLYLKSGNPEEAAGWLTKADALDKHDRRGRKELWASVLGAMGNWEAAVIAQESAFRRSVSYDNYQRLMEFAEHAGYAKVVHGSVISFLRSEDQPRSWADEIRALPKLSMNLQATYDLDKAAKARRVA